MHKFVGAIVAAMEAAFGGNIYLVTIFISMIPTIEVRGAITVATSLGMNVWLAFLISCVSALVVCPILLLCLKPLLKAMKNTKWFNKLASAVEDAFKNKAEKIENDSAQSAEAEGEDKAVNTQLSVATATDKLALLDARKKFNKALGIFIFVAVPLPMTGVWTGSAIAAFLDLEYRYSVPAIILGNFVAGLIITVLNIILGKYAPLILLALLIFALVTLVAFIVGIVIKVKKNKRA
jgi:uncharacterized membrane protein